MFVVAAKFFLNSAPPQFRSAAACRVTIDLHGVHSSVLPWCIICKGQPEAFCKTKVPRGIAANLQFWSNAWHLFSARTFLTGACVLTGNVRLLLCIRALQFLIGFQNQSRDARDITEVRSKGQTKHFNLRVIQSFPFVYNHFCQSSITENEETKSTKKRRRRTNLVTSRQLFKWSTILPSVCNRP